MDAQGLLALLYLRTSAVKNRHTPFSFDVYAAGQSVTLLHTNLWTAIRPALNANITFPCYVQRL